MTDGDRHAGQGGGRADRRHDHPEAHGGGGHDHHDHGTESVAFAVVTVSSTRDRAEDTAGDTIEAAIESSTHTLTIRELISDDLDDIQDAVDRLVDRDDVDCVVTTGGTGVTPDDVTVEAVTPLFDKELPGFGELFRAMSRSEVGTSVVATRATAGVVDGVPVFSLPGSENAARLGIDELVLPEAGHIVGLATR